MWLRRAADIALGAIADHVAAGGGVQRVDVALHGNEAAVDAWRAAARELLGPPSADQGSEAEVYDVCDQTSFAALQYEHSRARPWDKDEPCT